MDDFGTPSPSLKGGGFQHTRLLQPKFHTEILIGDSDWVAGIQYDPSRGILDARLKSGSRYRYRAIDSRVFADLVTAESVGQAFNKLIKPRAHTRLPARKIPG